MQTRAPLDNTLRGTILAIHDGKATVRLNAPDNGGGCGACVHGASCGIGRLAAIGAANAKPARGMQLNLDAPPGIGAGEQVHLLAPQAGLPLLALLGYVFPAFAMLLGAALGQFLQGDGLAALFSLLAFLLALALARFAAARCSGLYPRICSLSNTESSHEH
ncbi:MAG: SoxR reducing system RseC family protein [Candidatus Accumulibacter sp.]|jgi:sigma-E factor negative regulatory protein RseC|nr:SoxR reducing system RseC family protein [Accumulibacter sp.]